MKAALLAALVASAALFGACTSGSSDATANVTGAATPGDIVVPPVDAGAVPDAASHGPYPAPHPAPPQVLTLDGPTLANPRLVPVFWPDDVDETYVRSFLDAYVTSDIYTTQTQEYGIGPATVTATAHPTDDQPAAIHDLQIRQWLTDQFDAPNGVLPLPDANTVYLLYFPAGTNIAAGDGLGDIGCQDFLAYHESADWHGQNVAYAVFPRCAEYSGINSKEALTAASNHEIVEAATDPYPDVAPAYIETDPSHGYWSFEVGGSEVADMCQLLIGSFGFFDGFPYNLQRTWSNASTMAGHEPCLPAPAGPYFASVPVLPDVATYQDMYGNQLTTGAVHIPVGASQTIDVDLFSDEPTDGPWTVIVRDNTTVHGSAQTLNFTFAGNVDTGSNGDVLKMTISVLQAPTNGVEGFWVFSEKGGRTTSWLGVVTN